MFDEMEQIRAVSGRAPLTDPRKKCARRSEQGKARTGDVIRYESEKQCAIARVLGRAKDSACDTMAWIDREDKQDKHRQGLMGHR